ncbi:Kelch repeat-containing protein [Pseudocercospora fuligena]|uniref:Kelch repeat-containing protein n=1 Tax=Pseudocercospora fuligena TaxID=685502 RepID=A0A8H6VFN6_9PEZI|nr:Kelch repeat-containing protein [Pseudocercospora fuligena]
MGRISANAMLVYLLYIAQTQAQDMDQINHFCRRHSHRTTVIDNKLYIDGGYINYDYDGGIAPDTVNYTNTQLIYADLSSVNGDNFPQEYANLSKDTNVPSLVGGTTWADQVNKKFFLFGGEYRNTTAQPVPLSFDNIYWYDTLVDKWSTNDTTNSGIDPPSYGASTVDQNKGIAYYYGGWSSNATVSGEANTTMQNTFLSYDMVHNTFSKHAFWDDTPRAEGAMFYIPAGDAGMLVYFGGIQQNSSGYTSGVPMGTIYLYDIAADKFYQQQTSGEMPAMRRRFCGGVSWPNDTSSYNIYFFGGLQPEDQGNESFGDAWILSIPSFTWTLLYPYNYDGTGHHSLSCDVINHGQMIIMGGWWSNASYTACDAASIWGMHNLNLGSNDRDRVPWYQFLPNLVDYTLPPNLTAVIGGSSTGGATVTEPATTGFSNSDLRRLFQLNATTSTRNATRGIPTATSAAETKNNGSSNVGAIAGGVVGGVLGLALLIGSILLCLRRRRKSEHKTAQSDASSPSPRQMQQATMAEAADSMAAQQYHAAHKRKVSGGTHGSWSHTPAGSPPVQQNQWQPQQFREDLPQHQPYYPPPPQAQPFYPPPPEPEQYDPPSPTYEMPNVRSPLHVSDQNRPGSLSPHAWRTPSAGARGTIDEE